MTKSEKIYFDKLTELLSLQIKILESLKENNYIENECFEERAKLLSQVIILKPDTISDDSVKIKEDIVNIENKIIKEAKQLLNISKLQIDQHNKSTNKMLNYFKSQIELQSEIDLKI